MFIQKIGVIGKTYRHIQRYRQILTVLFKYGFGDVVDTLKIEQYLEIGLNMVSRKRRERIETLTRAERLRMVVEELGPTFVKMGQILSTRPDLLPPEFLQELQKLQDHVHPFSFEQAKQIVETELGKPLSQAYQSFDENPLASASIGQVHRARLITGEDVVVKIQRPGIQKIIDIDLEIILHIATLMEKHLEGWNTQRPTKIVEEFARTLEKELDYGMEAAHTEHFAMQFSQDATIYVPKIYHEATTRRVLTMERIEGIKISDVHRLEEEGLDRRIIARSGFDLIMKQVFTYGFFHADPHPGNVFVLPQNVICYLDFGMMGRIDTRTRDHFAELLMSIVQRNETKVTNALITITSHEEEPDRHLLERAVGEFIDRHFYRSLKEVELGILLYQLFDVVAKFRLRIPPDLFLMIKALSTVEGIGRKLDPDLDIFTQAEPFMRQVQIDRLNPEKIAADIFNAGTDLVHLLKEIPKDFENILKQFKEGKVKIGFEHRGLKPMLYTLDRISNRIAFAIVLASLVIGSSLIVLSGISPTWHEIPVIGLIGFIISGFMGFWLLLSTLKNGKM